MKNWLEIAVGIFLTGMMLYGHYKGFLRLAVSAAALIATLVIVNVAMPEVSSFLKDHTPVYHWVEQQISEVFTLDHRDDGTEMRSEQRQAIEELNLPREIKNMLIENNNSEIYQSLGVSAFTDYVGQYLTDVIFHAFSFIVLFILVRFGIFILVKWLDLVARLPIISGLNQLAGALLGGIQGLFYLWIGCLFLTAFSATAWASSVLMMIEESKWLSFLYHYNVVSQLFFVVLQNIIS